MSEPECAALRFAFIDGPWENSRVPTITRDCPAGGDPHILGAFSRVHNPNGLYELCRLANVAPDMLAALKAAQLIRPTNWDDEDDSDQVAAWRAVDEAVALAEGLR